MEDLYVPPARTQEAPRHLNLPELAAIALDTLAQEGHDISLFNHPFEDMREVPEMAPIKQHYNECGTCQKRASFMYISYQDDLTM